MSTKTDNTFPIFPGQVIVQQHKLHVITSQQAFVVDVPQALAKALVKECTGRNSVAQILHSLGKEWSVSHLERFISDLMMQGVLVDVQNQSSQMLLMLQNPQIAPVLLSPAQIGDLVVAAQRRQVIPACNDRCVIPEVGVLKLLHERSSCRNFSERPVDLKFVDALAIAAYGTVDINKRTTPSAGALYPLQLHLVLNRPSGPLCPGVYRVEYGSAGRLAYRNVGNQLAVVRGFMDQLMAHRAQGIVLVSANSHHHAVKYGVRALLYTILEAGHSAQNIHLVAQELGLRTVEIGGFVESVLTQALGLDPGYQPLTSVLFGYGNEDNCESDIEVEWILPQQITYMPDFSIAMARFSSEINEDWSYGRDKNPELAVIKAKAEAREWAACSFVPATVIKKPAKGLSEHIDPRTMVAFHPAQYRVKNFPFEQFDPETSQYWAVATEEETGDMVRVLADLMYFPYETGQVPYAYANSSGVAAHPLRQQAVESAVLELVERDAFMIAYHGRLSHLRVIPSSIPKDIQQRIQALELLGCRVDIVDITLELAPTVLVMLTQTEWHFMNVAAASRFDPVSALDHALMEVEASVLARLENGPAKKMSPSVVAMPLDHGALYEQQQYYRRADFLVAGPATLDCREIGKESACNWAQLKLRIRQLNTSLYTVDYNIPQEQGGNAGLHIVRAIIPGLVPMTFGYRQEPAGMKRLYQVASRLRGESVTYKDIVKFPHPFA